MRPSVPPAASTDAHLLASFDEEGIHVFSTCLVVGDRRWRLGELLRAEVVREPPPWRRYTGTLCAGLLLALVLMLALVGRGGAEGALHGIGLFVAACLIFGSLARLLLLNDTTCLVLHLSGGSERAYASTDHAFVVLVAAVLTDAMRALPRPS